MLRTYHKPRGLIYLLLRIFLSLRSWNQAYLEALILLKKNMPECFLLALFSKALVS